MEYRERKHRLPLESYRGEVSVAFTLCLKGKRQCLNQNEIVTAFVDILDSVTGENKCIVPVYCFMPDHQHLIITGAGKGSDAWNAVLRYKQKTGFWMSRNRYEMRWQKDFYDHIMRNHEDLVAQVKYVLDNPVRKGLVSSWQDYPLKGAIGYKLEDILVGIM
jgi:REP element-mobilizing transposase RayT